uniref:Putative ovule protein n=1 Tax=Solanum chacoense TaxID=4108 RepID=A0A0V0HP94_SOLCH
MPGCDKDCLVGGTAGVGTGTSGALGGLISMLWSGNVDALFIDGALLAFSTTSISGLLSPNVGIFLKDGAFLAFSTTSLSGLLSPKVGFFLIDGTDLTGSGLIVVDLIGSLLYGSFELDFEASSVTSKC